MVSASLKFSWSSLWQKYCDVNSSWVQMICAPCLAARSARASVFWRLVLGSAPQAFATGQGGRLNPEGALHGESSFGAEAGGFFEDFRLAAEFGAVLVGGVWPNSSRMNLPSVSFVGP
jgi:hypothetical protein